MWRTILHLLRHEWIPLRPGVPYDDKLIEIGFKHRCGYPRCLRID